MQEQHLSLLLRHEDQNVGLNKPRAGVGAGVG
jgi:hypothetical protein